MTKSDLIKRVANKAEIPKTISEIAVNMIFDSMQEALTKGGRIEIRGFGTFEVVYQKGRKRRNPKTGESCGYVDGCFKVKFRPGKTLSKLISTQEYEVSE